MVLTLTATDLTALMSFFALEVFEYLVDLCEQQITLVPNVPDPDPFIPRLLDDLVYQLLLVVSPFHLTENKMCS